MKGFVCNENNLELDYVLYGCPVEVLEDMGDLDLLMLMNCLRSERYDLNHFTVSVMWREESR